MASVLVCHLTGPLLSLFCCVLSLVYCCTAVTSHLDLPDLLLWLHVSVLSLMFMLSSALYKCNVLFHFVIGSCFSCHQFLSDVFVAWKLNLLVWIVLSLIVFVSSVVLHFLWIQHWRLLIKTWVSMKRRCSFTLTLWASVLWSCCCGTVARYAYSCWLKQTDKLRKGPCATVNWAVRGTGLLKTYFDPEGWSVCGFFLLLFHCFILMLKLYLHQKTWASVTAGLAVQLHPLWIYDLVPRVT